MIGFISMYVFLICLLFLLPLNELFPSKQLNHTINIILSRTGGKLNSTSSRSLKWLYPLLALINRLFKIDAFSPRWYKFKSQLRIANMERLFTVDQFVSLKYLISIFLFAYCLLLLAFQPSIELLIMAIALSFIGFYIPDQWLKIRISQRRWKIQREIPSILISLAVTTDAGLSLQQALEEVCRRKPGELSDEFLKTLQEIAVGIPQREAFENMINRVLVDELTLMVSALLQTMEKGSSGLTRILREQANEAWIKRKSKAKELGEKASIKLFLPLIGFILPALMIFLIAPAIFTIIRFFEF